MLTLSVACAAGRLAVAMIAVATMTTTTTAAGQPADGAGAPSVHAAVEKLFAAWNTKDPAAFGAVFPADAEYTDVVGNHVVGPDAIAELHVFPFQRLFARATLTLTDVRERELAPGVVTVDAGWRMTGHTDPSGTPLPTWEGVMHIITTERDGQWLPLIVHNFDITNARRAHPGPPAPAG